MVDYNKSWETWTDNRVYGATPRHIRNIIGDVVGELKYRSVLDIGCGNGSFLEFIKKASKRPELKLAGIDSSENAVEISKKAIPEAAFQVLDIEKESLNEKFDLVLCNDVLEHLNNDSNALKNIRQVTNKYFICNTIQGRMHESERLVGHVRNYKKEELLDKLRVAGFRPLKTIEWGFPFYNLLCRKMHIGITQKLIYGKYGFFKKMVSQITYLLFKINSKSKGDVLIVLSEAERQR